MGDYFFLCKTYDGSRILEYGVGKVGWCSHFCNMLPRTSFGKGILVLCCGFEGKTWLESKGGIY